MQRTIHVFILGLSFITFACSNSKRTNPRRLTVAISAQPASLDPRLATDAYGTRITSLIFSSLVRINSQLKLEGDAAISWKATKDRLSFQLRPNIRFSNNRELSAQDIMFSFSEYMKPSSPYASNLNQIKNIEVEGANDQGYKISLILKGYSAKLLTSDLPAVKLLPKKETLENPKSFSKKPIGTGHYKLLKQSPQSILLGASLNKSKPIPKVPELEFKVIKDDFTRFQKTLNGEIDIAQDEIPLEKIKMFENKPKEFTIHKYPGLAFTYILLNLRDPILKQKKYRRALAYAINRQEIIKYKLEGYGQLATSIVTPNNPYYNKDLQPILFNPDMAKELIKETVEPIQLELKTSSSPAAVDIAKVLKHQLEKIGLNLNIKSYEWGTYYGDIKKGNFQMATMRWVGVLDPDIYRASLHSAEVPPGRNRGHYKNKKLDALVMAGIVEREQKKRFEIYNEAQKIVMNELPIIPLWYNHQVAVVNARIRNFKPSMKGDYWPLIYVDKIK